MPERLADYHQEHDSYFLAKINRLTGMKVESDNGFGFVFDIYIDDFNKNPPVGRRFVNGEYDPDPWFLSLREGRNPSASFLQKQIEYLRGEAKVGEIVEIATKDNPMRWASSGGMVVIRGSDGKRYVPLSVRPKKLAIHAGKLDANGAGMSSSKMQMVAPEILGLTEIIEENIFVRHGKLLVPLLFSDLGPAEQEKMLNRLHYNELLQRQLEMTGLINPGWRNLQVEPISIAKITPPSMQDTLHIHYNRYGVTTARGIASFDPPTGALDLRNVYQIHVDDIKDLMVADGENEPRSPKMQMLIPRNREVLLFAVDELTEMVDMGGGVVTPVRTFSRGIPIPSCPMYVGFSSHYQGAVTEAGRGDVVLMTPSLELMIGAMSQIG